VRTMSFLVLYGIIGCPAPWVKDASLSSSPFPTFVLRINRSECQHPTTVNNLIEPGTRCVPKRLQLHQFNNNACHDKGGSTRVWSPDASLTPESSHIEFRIPALVRSHFGTSTIVRANHMFCKAR
jgi:hypothetical protein